jgi:hypothetical protein
MPVPQMRRLLLLEGERDITAGLKAMAQAILFPKAPTAQERGAKGGRGNKALEVTSRAFSTKLLQQARIVLECSSELADQVRDGVLPLNDAYEKVRAERPARGLKNLPKTPLLFRGGCGNSVSHLYSAKCPRRGKIARIGRPAAGRAGPLRRSLSCSASASYRGRIARACVRTSRPNASKRSIIEVQCATSEAFLLAGDRLAPPPALRGCPGR